MNYKQNLVLKKISLRAKATQTIKSINDEIQKEYDRMYVESFKEFNDFCIQNCIKIVKKYYYEYNIVFNYLKEINKNESNCDDILINFFINNNSKRILEVFDSIKNKGDSNE